MTDKSKLANGYRQGVITAITVLLTASFLYFRFIAFDPDSGDWTFWGAVCAILAGISICIQLLALWRALQPEDEQVSIYRVTLRWLAAGVLLLVGS
jgi:4-amino-4-deoxy-L-arabinose transferase-like glycosyltransferase